MRQINCVVCTEKSKESNGFESESMSWTTENVHKIQYSQLEHAATNYNTTER